MLLLNLTDTAAATDRVMAYLVKAGANGGFITNYFRESFSMYGRNVTCDNTDANHIKYLTPTWTCENLKVDEKRIHYSYYWGVRVPSSKTKRCNNHDKNDLFSLCENLLRVHDVSPPNVLMVQVEKGGEECSTANGETIHFRPVADSAGLVTYWQPAYNASDTSGGGFLHTIQCLTRPKDFPDD